MSLLANQKVSAFLNLVGTMDIDAHLEKVDHLIKMKMVKLFNEHHFVYDEDSEKVWLPPKCKFEKLFGFNNLEVSVLDPESALVSKAIKAREKNRLLIQIAIASGRFPNLIRRIESHGGDLNFFLEEN